MSFVIARGTCFPCHAQSLETKSLGTKSLGDKMTRHSIRVNGFLFASLVVASITTAAAKDSNPEAVCKSALLSYQQQYICKQELEKAKTSPDQKQVVQKFTKIVKEEELALEKARKK